MTLLFDTLDASQRLQEAGFEEGQAAAMVSVFSRELSGNLATKDQVEGLRADVTQEIASVRGEIAELRGEIAELRSEVRSEIAEVRSEIAELRGEVRSEIAEVRGEIAELRGEVRGEIAEVRGEVAQLRDKMETMEQRLVHRMTIRLGIMFVGAVTLMLTAQSIIIAFFLRA